MKSPVVTVFPPAAPCLKDEELLLMRDSIDLADANANHFRGMERMLRLRKFATADGALFNHYREAIARAELSAELWEAFAVKARALHAEREAAA